ncbi:MAG: tRNA glutamyl-Q(34) synthetase GluQRS [Gammaproteobacteria bacterium]|nr:MAG: tRNA glutamyl-Q(34) synthetase GluQRS [Gammaproteobacteria bacterium]
MQNSSTNNNYIGRFAPSPTGPLHFGSLVAAVGSYLEAKTNHGKWLLRVEDIDPPREVKGATKNIISTLEQFGFEWDEHITYQSRRYEIYQEYIDQLLHRSLAYSCGCSRKEIAKTATRSANGLIYPGTCRIGLGNKEPRSVRLLTENIDINFHDLVQGVIIQNLETESGDYVIKRADGLYAYNLAVVIDDQLSGITDIVRGHDLLACTCQHIYLQRVLHFDTPRYAHLPIAINKSGQKLSKQNLAKEIDTHNKAQALFNALTFLNQNPDKQLLESDLDSIWNWSIENWNIGAIKGVKEKPAIDP